MGYDLTIGELTTDYYPNDSYIALGAQYQYDEKAPTFPNEDESYSKSSQKA